MSSVNGKKHPGNLDEWERVTSTVQRWKDENAEYVIGLGVQKCRYDYWYLDYKPAGGTFDDWVKNMDMRPDGEPDAVEFLMGSAAIHYDSEVMA